MTDERMLTWDNPVRDYGRTEYAGLVVAVVTQLGMAAIGAALALKVVFTRVMPAGCGPRVPHVFLSDYCIQLVREFQSSIKLSLYAGAASLLVAAVLQWRWLPDA